MFGTVPRLRSLTFVLCLALWATSAHAEDEPDVPAEGEAAEAEETETAEEAPPALPTAPPQTPSAQDLQPAMQDRSAPRPFEVFAEQTGTAAPAGATASAPAAEWRRISEAELLEPSQTFPAMEWHGSFRFRADSFYHLSLGTEGTSAQLPPVQSVVSPTREETGFPAEAGGDSTARFHDHGSTRTGGANMRLRLRPVVHIAEDLRLHLEMDVVDNVVMGSNPSRRFGSLTEQTTQSQTGAIGTDNLLVVRQAYGEVQTFAGTLTLGRQASHWGLGILDHGGGGWQPIREPRATSRAVALAGHTCLDCDYATIVDRAQFRMNLFETYFAVSWDYNDAGVSNALLHAPLGTGQPQPLGRYDNTHSLTLQVFQRPLRPMEIAARNRTLKELREGAFDWGLYVQHRRQNIRPEDGNQLDRWTPSGMRLWIPDLWLRYTREPAFRRRFRLELEGVAVLGSVDNVNPGIVSGQDTDPFADEQAGLISRDVRQFGAALELEVQNKAVSTGFNTGFATGRDTDNIGGTSFGLLDGPVDPLAENRLTAFAFHPNYFVDVLLFREIIGAVSNATYFNPFISYDFFAKQEDVFGVRFDLVTALAVESSVTPSGSSFYGVETDLQFYYREPRYGADLTFGLLFPGRAFNAVAGRQRLDLHREVFGTDPLFLEDRSAKPAAALQARFFWAF